MVEYHGWITLRDSPSDSDEYRTAEIVQKLESTIDHLRANHRVLGLKTINANYVVWMSGYTNHWSAEIEGIIDLFAQIADKAPGSYGLLYAWNDESDTENAFRVWRLAKGRLTEHEDSLLSPCVPTIEDQLN